MKKGLILLLLSCFLNFPLFAEEISAPNIKVELVSEYDAFIPGKEQYLALRLKPENHWHVYWKYQGDTGTAPKLAWEKQEGVEFGNIQWPYPEKIKISHLVNYGYSDETLLLIPVKISKDIQKPSINLTAKAEWLVCQEECIPGFADLHLEIKIADKNSKTKWADKFDNARKKLPLEINGLNISAENLGGNELQIILNESSAAGKLSNKVTFIPASGKQIENAAEQEVIINEKSLILKLEKSKSDPIPEKLSGILISVTGWNENYPQALSISADVKDAAVNETNKLSILNAVIFAFIGGLILNLMPCVFPILSIKILGFVNKSQKDRKKIFKHGLAFGGGVLVSFWILAGLLIFLQAAGYKLGWGFQLQSPYFLMFIIILLFLVALNLYGFFEAGARLQNFFSGFSAKGYADSFLSGVLATVLATPCTAPFMGAAIAASLNSSKPIAFAIFTFLGIGMALPYVILSGSPSLLRFVPKPGPWMEKFKQLLSFPVFATVIWLITVFLSQTGPNFTSHILFSLLGIYFALWILKHYSGIARIISALVIAISVYIAIPAPPEASDEVWQVYSNKKLDELVSQGSPVFIDFTAEWCLTCKLNKYVALDTKNVQEKFKEKGVILLKGDWTSVDPEISEKIKSYGRSGVPLNVLYYGKGKKDPYIFPSVLTSGMVQSELEKIGH